MKTADLLRHADRRDHATPAVAVPPSLVAFHATVREVHIHQLTPLSALQIADGFVCIYLEEQGGFEWALRETELDQEDPAVWGRWTEPGSPWSMQAPTLSLFLAQVLVLDATVLGISETGFYSAGEVSSAEVERVLAPMERMPWPRWTWFACGFYAGDGAVASVNGEDHWHLVYVGGRTDEELEPFRSLAIGDDWSWSAPA